MPCQSCSRPTGSRFAAGAALALALGLGACNPDRVSTGSTFPYDHRERHPIVLTDTPEMLDVFAVAHSGLDRRERQDVLAFAREYRKSGRGPIVAHVPAGRHSAKALSEIRSILGLPVTVTSYVASDPKLAAPIRLSYPKLAAKVATQCGRWPDDLGVSDLERHADNRPYWNLGCATRSNFAQQAADPVDLVRGRSEGRVDTGRRMTVMKTWRDGQDSTTEFSKPLEGVAEAVSTD